MILLIDNYDSFTFNILQYLEELLCHHDYIQVTRNDSITIDQIRSLSPTHIVISPGPCSPNEAGISLELINTFSAEIPILGICLGHQAIGQAFGARIVRATYPMHGKTSLVHHNSKGIFRGIENPFLATRYHSLVINPLTLPECLERSAWTEDGVIMGISHQQFPHVNGLQFHPESIMTRVGKALLANFLSLSCPKTNTP